MTQALTPVVQKMMQSIAQLNADGLPPQEIAGRLNREFAYVPPKLRQRFVQQALNNLVELKKENDRAANP